MFYQILSAVWEVHSPFSLISDANKFASVNSGAKLKKNPSIKGRHKGIRKVYPSHFVRQKSVTANYSWFKIFDSGED